MGDMHRSERWRLEVVHYDPTRAGSANNEQTFTLADVVVMPGLQIGSGGPVGYPPMNPEDLRALGAFYSALAERTRAPVRGKGEIDGR